MPFLGGGAKFRQCNVILIANFLAQGSSTKKLGLKPELSNASGKINFSFWSQYTSIKNQGSNIILRPYDGPIHFRTKNQAILIFTSKYACLWKGMNGRLRLQKPSKEETVTTGRFTSWELQLWPASLSKDKLSMAQGLCSLLMNRYLLARGGHKITG